MQLHHHLARAAEVIGDVSVDEVDDNVILRVVKALYPNGAQPSTLNRHIYTPIISVLRHAARNKGWTVDITRPAGHSERKQVKAPDGLDWYRRVLPHCSPNMRAVVLFCRLHNRRGADAFRAVRGHLIGDFLDIVPPEGQKSKTKAERIRLSSPVIAALTAAGRLNVDKDEPLFGYRYSTRRNAWRDLNKACKRASKELQKETGNPDAVVEMYSLHRSGRHSFLRHHLDQGGSLADLTQLGRWSDPALPALLYGRREETALDAKYLPKANELGDEMLNRSASGKENEDR